MDIRQHSSQFTIFVFTTDVDLGASAKVYLSQAGYDAYYFQDPEVLETRIKESAPHILVFPTASVEGSLSDFISLVQEINEETKFIAISANSQFDILAQYNSHGLVDVISDDSTGLENRILWSVDRACEKIYLLYQNEQLFDELETSGSQLKEAHAAVLATMKEKADADLRAPSVVTIQSQGSLAMKITDYQSAQSKEDLIQKFMNHFPHHLCLYFKFLPTVRSFVATHSQGVSAADIQGVGVQLESEDLKDLVSQAALGLLPRKFSHMLVEAFHFNPPKALPIYTSSGLEGVFIHSGSLPAEEIAKINEEYSLMTLCYSNFYLLKKVEALEVQDFVTELFNRKYYMRELSEEVTRARRLRQPISVVKISVDDIYEIESSLGERVRDDLLKAVATVLSKTSRVNDVSCRSGSNEFAMILPHTSKKGAALRAERLRRIIESSNFLDSGMKVSVSLGVSEYPSLADSDKALDESASKALLHITNKGGNKICLFKAPESYQPEFEIPAE